jgi:undecaprenyl-phosphate galactose phosphotransferase
VAKRVFDIVFALAALIMTLPIMIVAAILIKLTSPGPVLYSHIRCGKGGKQFTCYKFRTMVNGADNILQFDRNLAAEFGKSWKLDKDPRITPVGKWLRKTSIDELPQFLNVLRGDLAIVGPRPVQPNELRQCFGVAADTVISVKPGITGLWQVSGRSSLDYDRRVALDLTYIRNRGFMYDIMLILRTIPAVLTGKGAV